MANVKYRCSDLIPQQELLTSLAVFKLENFKLIRQADISLRCSE